MQLAQPVSANRNTEADSFKEPKRGAGGIGLCMAKASHQVMGKEKSRLPGSNKWHGVVGAHGPLKKIQQALTQQSRCVHCRLSLLFIF